jgi:hypothetical protein
VLQYSSQVLGLETDSSPVFGDLDLDSDLKAKNSDLDLRVGDLCLDLDLKANDLDLDSDLRSEDLTTTLLNRFHFLRSIMLVPSSLIRTFYFHSLAIFPFPSFISRYTTHRGGSRVVGHRDGLTKVGILVSKSCGCPSYN